jgi:hypothetical protein
MIAFESLNPANRIADAVCLSISWDDQPPGLYVVPRSELASYPAGRSDADKRSVDVVLDIEALAKARTGAWIGIKIASTHGVAAWGRAKLENDNGRRA